MPHTLALAPRVPHVHELESLHVWQICHLKHTVRFIELDSFNTIAFDGLVILILNNILANNKEALLMLLLEILPELSRVDLRFDFRLC